MSVSFSSRGYYYPGLDGYSGVQGVSSILTHALSDILEWGRRMLLLLGAASDEEANPRVQFRTL